MLDPKKRLDLIEFVKTLISNYPYYKSEGIFKNQRLIEGFLKENAFDEVVFDSFHAEEIEKLPGYLDVSQYDGIYSDYRSIEKHNVYGVMRGAGPGPCLILNGHVDVDIVDETRSWDAPEGWKNPKEIDGKLYGRGSTDMLSGLACQMHVAAELAKNRDLWSGTVIFCSVCDEEIGGNGTLRSLDFLKSKGYLGDHKGMSCLIAEPSEDKPCSISLGFMPFEIRIETEPSHMGLASPESNAFFILKKIEREILDLIQQKERDLGIVKKGYVKLNFGKLEGGIDSAIPIGNLRIGGVCFLPEEIPVQSLSKILKQTVEKNPGCQITFTDPQFEGRNDQEGSLAKACERILGLRPELFPSPCDARLFRSYGIDTLVFGPGSLAQAHSVNEYIQIKDIEVYFGKLDLLVKEFLGWSQDVKMAS